MNYFSSHPTSTDLTLRLSSLPKHEQLFTWKISVSFQRQDNEEENLCETVIKSLQHQFEVDDYVQN